MGLFGKSKKERETEYMSRLDVPSCLKEDFELIIDDIFTIMGVGTVATGNILTGMCREGENACIYKANGDILETRITTVDVHTKERKANGCGYTYNDMDDLIEVCVKNMVSENFTEEQARSYMKELLPTLDYWKKYDELSDNGQFEEFKKKLINEINELNVDGMPKVEKLNALVGKYVNLEYRLPNGQAAKFLNEAKTYLGNQLECEYGGDRCFGVVADMDFILICTYEEDGKNPELVLYKKR